MLTKEQAIERLNKDKEAKCNSDIQKKTDIEKLIEFIGTDCYKVAGEYLKLSVAAISPDVLDFIDFSNNAAVCVITLNRSLTSFLPPDFLATPMSKNVLLDKAVVDKTSPEAQKIMAETVDAVVRDFINANITVGFAVKSS
jgi:hypothetical protein